jgi:hypothetical protein
MDMTFTITVTGREHKEWQGEIIAPDGQETSFRSVLELLKTIQNELPEKA